MNIDKLVRRNILDLEPYRSARQDHLDGILLDANENAFGSPVFYNGLDLHRYPDPYQSRLRDRIAEIHNIPANYVFIGSGSDEVIDLLYRVFCEPAVDNVIIPEPTYGMYRVSANVHGVAINRSLLTDEFQLDVNDILSRRTNSTKLIFCCSPNNPTGNLFMKKDVLQLCKSIPAIVVVDEAYIEFAESDSLTECVESYPNLVIMRTLSKSWGLAGIRLGYCIAQEKIIQYLLKVKPPYNVNSVSAKIAHESLDTYKQRENIIQDIRNERKRLVSYLSGFDYVQQVYPSDANFVLVKVDNANNVYNTLIDRGIIIRNRSSEPKLDNCIRITVGTPEENDILLAAMEEIRI